MFILVFLLSIHINKRLIYLLQSLHNQVMPGLKVHAVQETPLLPGH